VRGAGGRRAEANPDGAGCGHLLSVTRPFTAPARSRSPAALSGTGDGPATALLFNTW
jgi:hypothetical protein